MSTTNEVDERLSPIQFANLSREFLEAARREFASRQVPGRPDVAAEVSIPGYFLATRAIELALKSFLLLRGRSGEEIKKNIGHDLKKALNEADEASMRELVQLEQGHVEALTWINEYYVKKDLEYITTGYKSYPDHKWVLACADSILDGIQPELRGLAGGLTRARAELGPSSP